MRFGALAGCLLAASLLAGCTDYGGSDNSGNTASSAGALPANIPPGDQLYVAVSGDTVDSVAQLFGVPVQSLIDTNHLSPPYELTPGQELDIPHGSAASGGVYTVVPGDTLTRIARQHATTVSALAAANGLVPPYLIKVGQQIQLPGSPEVESASAAPGMVLPPAQPGPSLPAAGSASMTTESLAPPPGVSAAPLPGSSAPAAPASLPGAGSTAGTQSLPSPVLTAVTPAAAPPGQPLAVAQPQPEPAAGTTATGAGAQASVLPPPPPPPKPSTLSAIGQATAALEPQVGQSGSETAPAARSSGKFFWPVNGKVISPFGPKDGGQHNDGINIAAPLGTPVKAAENGVVVYAGNELRGFGNLLLIRHADGWVSAYAHCDTLLVKRGAQVKRGQVIARVGQTGNVDSPQLHFELRKGAQAVDPMTELAPQGA